MAVLLPHALFRFSSLLLRIENPYTQRVWIANPDQRHGTEHPRGRVSILLPLLYQKRNIGASPINVGKENAFSDLVFCLSHHNPASNT